ncbi:RsmB/NOP family class I SAM-dependent RNA methyltransferase [Kordiimonas aestuarii]|uniref:RsmB/NOP family class I SAM-dependent RNA methyltransferase n=1 Tax=Kordiimonas aestuarii TaxID=1005925 RepID=UPI0021CEC741|nr:RsmB/NOP family class I SAM-dependent RNA methyltransferase [Kordiimonas aestuarii]
MQPSARLAAAIEILASIEVAIMARGLPADRLVADYFRARRFAGSKDKRAISDMVYGVLRQREVLLWALEEATLSVDGRSLLIAYLCRHDAESLGLFGGDDKFAPPAPSGVEESGITTLKSLNWATAPVEARCNVPAWAAAGLHQRFGADFETAMAAFHETAPLDIRINALKDVGLDIKSKLSIPLEAIEKNKYSSFGYRIHARVNLGADKSYRGGYIEVQDEAAQVASALVAAEPGHQVVDLCAGGGGKSLAVAADMANKGQIHAFDISGKRLADFRHRIQRAGVRNIQVTRLAPEGSGRKSALQDLVGRADRVVVDVPCTGTGTWRRSPDQRWRFDETSLAEINKLQATILREAASLVKVRGRLVYMTCSLLPAENEQIIQGFMKQAADGWKLLDYRDIWRAVLASAVPDTVSQEPKCLQFAPHSHGTDGFFVALLERQA